jgi:catechol 2,3-dioxygenase-like lactoylglutathione lyase family enzyme
MLTQKEAMATIAVRKLDTAKSFYEGKLGLEPMPAGEQGAVAYKTGRSVVLVYESRYAGTNQATSATWTVGDDLESIVRDLKAKGVRFEHYDLPGTRQAGDIHVSGKTRVAWFKDPDGNILSLVNG